MESLETSTVDIAVGDLSPSADHFRFTIHCEAGDSAVASRTAELAEVLGFPPRPNCCIITMPVIDAGKAELYANAQRELLQRERKLVENSNEGRTWEWPTSQFTVLSHGASIAFLLENMDSVPSFSALYRLSLPPSIASDCRFSLSFESSRTVTELLHSNDLLRDCLECSRTKAEVRAPPLAKEMVGRAILAGRFSDYVKKLAPLVTAFLGLEVTLKFASIETLPQSLYFRLPHYALQNLRKSLISDLTAPENQEVLSLLRESGFSGFVFDFLSTHASLRIENHMVGLMDAISTVKKEEESR